MKSINFKPIIPHLIAAAIFLLVSVIFCKPALEGNVVLKQGDVASWQGMSHQSIQYAEKNGHFPLWATNMFGGMPAYQIAMQGDWSPIGYFDKIFQLGLPQPFNFFYLACICFYFLCICIGIRPFAAIIGSLAFAYCSYSPIIVTAGHNTKMLALAYAPAVLGAIVLVFNKKYLLGFVLAGLFTALQIGQGHQQISYYLFLVIAFMVISYLFLSIKSKEISHFFKSVSLIVIAGVLGVATNALVLWTTFDYSKESKRGGQLILDQKGNGKDKIQGEKTTGLSKDYAFMWSYGKAETWSLMFPGVLGYGSHQAERDGDVYIFPKIKDDGHLVNYMNENLPQFPADQIAGQMNGALYWGAQPFTNGPVYLGAVICFLFLFGMFYLDNKHKWWILAASFLAILLSWGDNFSSFNYFMFDHFPLYNKFRVPTMILVVPQLLFPLVAALTINKLVDTQDENSWNKFKIASIATLVVFGLISLFYFTADFSKENKERTNAYNSIIRSGAADAQLKLQQLDEKYKPSIDNQIYEGMVSNISRDANAGDPTKSARGFVNALREDRASILFNDILRSLLMVLFAAAIIALFLKQKINATIMIVGVTLISTIDLLQFGSNYLNDKSFDNKDNYESNEFPLTTADKNILEDKDPNFRVMNTSSMEESHTSYYHKCIGGYHPAKLGIYDDLIAYQFNGRYNMSVINMLNTKYFIQQQGNDKVAQLNPSALGNVWFVKNIQFVDGPGNEMRAISNFNPKDTAYVDASFKNIVGSYTQPDSMSSIKMTSFDNDAITYESNSSVNNSAIFSEIYYKDWKAYIDGKEVPFYKANYVLRGLTIPAGKHKIDFKFEPQSFFIGKKISNISSWLLFLILIGTIVREFISKKKEV
jgi:hypothetical protein